MVEGVGAEFKGMAIKLDPTFPLRLLDRSVSPTGVWVCLLLVGGAMEELGARSDANSQLTVSAHAHGVVVQGPLQEVGNLGHALGTQRLGGVLRVAVTALQGPPRPLQLGGHRWAFGRVTRLLGVVNVTPDSFSGDGVGRSAGAALDRAAQMVEDGADAIDIGGESSRPGHLPVSADEEMERTVPAVAKISRALPVPVFVDTWKAAVADAALRAGAVCVNDIWGLRRDPQMAEVVAAHGAAVVAMHNRDLSGYHDLVGEVLSGLDDSLTLARKAGIPSSKIMLDPGIGFGKTPAESLMVLGHLEQLRLLGKPLLLGTSRKSLVGWLLGNRPVEGRLMGTAATVAWAAGRMVEVVRVHDVAAMHDAALVAQRLGQVERAEPW